MNKINLTIDGTNKYIKIEFLKSDNTTVGGTDYINGAFIGRIRDEKDGWWIDRMYEAEYNNKIFFAQIVNYNGSAIGSTSQATITAALLTLWAAATP